MKNKIKILLVFAIPILFLSSCSKSDFNVNVFVYYCVDENCSKMGYIDGAVRQTPYIGQFTTKVSAVARDGYKFVAWNDGLDNPSRSDVATNTKMQIYSAVFCVV